MRFVGNFVLLPVLLCFGVVQWIGLRVAADGLVHASVATERAPALLRVVDVYVKAGDRCERGDPLLLIEAIEGSHAREALAAEASRRALRLEFLRAGGSLQGSDSARVSDQRERAERELGIANGEVSRLSAERGLLASERDAEEAGIRSREAAIFIRIEPLEARLSAARERQQDAAEETSIAQRDVLRSENLVKDGTVSDRERSESLTSLLERSGNQASRDADAEALQAELAGTRELLTLEKALGVSLLRELDARQVELDRRIQVARSTRRSWRVFAARHRALSPEQDVAPKLRDLELSILEAELAEARARLADHDVRHGTAVVRARTAGVVDRVMAEPGQIVEVEGELITLVDDRSLRVIAYVDPEDADLMRVGGYCTITSSADGVESLDGEIVNVGRALLRAPEQVHLDEMPYADYRLPVSILLQPSDVGRLRVNERVRVVFARPADRE